MRIAFDISSIPYGTGVSRYTTNLVPSLSAQLSPENRLCLFGGALRHWSQLWQFSAKLKEKQAIKFFPFPPSLMTALFHQANIPLEMLVGEVDVFHSWDWYLPRAKKAAVVVTIHDLALFKFPATAHPKIRQHHQQVLNRIESSSAQVIAVSQATKADLLSLTSISEERIQVVYEALPIESQVDLSPEASATLVQTYTQGKPYFLIVGTQEPRKNIPRMVEAWRNHFSQDFVLVLAGKSAWEEIPDQPGLIKTGYVEGSVLAALYQQASCFLYCSLYEGFGLPILEAFYHGTPVVTANLSSMPEVAGEAAVLVDPRDLDSISQGIRQALDNRQKLVTLGSQRLESFSWEKAASQTLQVYQQIVETRQ